MAAEVLAQGGVDATIYDAMPSAGRKFLMAGRGGLNLTHSEALPEFLARYRAAEQVIGHLMNQLYFGSGAYADDKEAQIGLTSSDAMRRFLTDYREGLRLLADVPGVRVVVPGHGHVGDDAEFRRRIAADLAYLDGLQARSDADDSRLTEDWLRAEHARQRARAGARGRQA